MSLHQLADRYPWQPGTWVNDEVAHADGTREVEITKDLSVLTDEERFAVRATAGELSRALVNFERLWQDHARFWDHHEALRRFLADQNAVVHARHQARRKNGL
jgi:hypothetical protein